jgi:hypothetical protein
MSDYQGIADAEAAYDAMSAEEQAQEDAECAAVLNRWSSYTSAEDPFGYLAQRDRTELRAEAMEVLHNDGNLYLRGKFLGEKGTAAEITEAGVNTMLAGKAEGAIVMLPNGVAVEKVANDWNLAGSGGEDGA